VKLPQPEHLIVEEEKITGYLLNPKHPYGRAKAKFFMTLGFRVEEWSTLADALREHGRIHEIKSSRETGFGPRYIVEGDLKTPTGRLVFVRSTWQFDSGSVAPRLITAYPVKRR
jgi:hypothetical protein